MDTKDLRESYKEHQLEIKSRLKDFSELPKDRYIKELWFCILTPQSNAEKCWQAVEELEKCRLEESSVKNCLKTRTRFYRNKTRCLLEATNNWKIVEDLVNSHKSPTEMREEIVKNVKGLGLKEASHFLRNIGKSKNQLAILDRHILRKMKELNLTEEDKIRNIKDYLNKEVILKNFSQSVGIPLDSLDLLFWKLESGRIFK